MSRAGGGGGGRGSMMASQMSGSHHSGSSASGVGAAGGAAPANVLEEGVWVEEKDQLPMIHYTIDVNFAPELKQLVCCCFAAWISWLPCCFGSDMVLCW